MNVNADAIGRRVQQAADLPVRLALGSAMLYHGLAKLRGEGRVQTAAWFAGLGLRPGHVWATATGVAETFAGAAAILGIATRPAALAVVVTQAVAARKVHAERGFDNTKGGMEYNLTLIAVALGLLVNGAGPLSASAAARAAAMRRRATVRGRAIPGLGRLGRRSGLERGLALLH